MRVRRREVLTEAERCMPMLSRMAVLGRKAMMK